MNITRHDLYRIILEEYLKEEGITEANRALDLLRKMKGDPDYDPRKDPGAHSYDPAFKGDDETVADEPPPSDETYPMEKPLRGKMSQDELVLTIGELVHGKDPEEVSEIFELVFEKLPGVEIGEPEEEPERLYTPGAEGRPVAGFQLENLMELIREVLGEGHYHDMGDEDEMYNVVDSDPFAVADFVDLDHEKFEQAWADDPSRLSDVALVNYAKKFDLDKIIVYDGDGDLANREELEDVIAIEIPKLQASDRY